MLSGPRSELAHPSASARPRVAIVLPTFNRKEYLGLTVASVQRQTVRDWELLIVDDGSTDGTREVAQHLADADPRLKVLSQANGFISAARNLGIRNMDRAVEFVIFLDDDDLLEPGALQTLIDALEARPTAVAVHGLARLIDERGEELEDDAPTAMQFHRKGIRGARLVDWPAHEATTFAVFAFCDFIPSPGQVLIRRSALDRAGHFRDPAEDWDMWLRLTTHGDFVFANDVVLNYRWHVGNVSQNVLKSTRGKIVVHWRLLWSRGLTGAQRRAAWFGFFYYYANLGRLGRTAGRLLARLAKVLRQPLSSR